MKADFVCGIFLAAALLSGGLFTEASAEEGKEQPLSIAGPSISTAKKKPVEIEMEYMEPRFYKDRHIKSYDLHVYEPWKVNGTFSIWKGLTIQRATGYTSDDHIRRDSKGAGIGPSILLRWEKPISGKLSGGFDGTGSILLYDKAFPARGRAFGFMWRIGPRLSYRWNEDNGIRLGWSYMHCSNGFKSHNPGLNAAGFMIGYEHRF